MDDPTLDFTDRNGWCLHLHTMTEVRQRSPCNPDALAVVRRSVNMVYYDCASWWTRQVSGAPENIARSVECVAGEHAEF